MLNSATFDLRYPPETLATKESRRALKQILAHLLDLQREWNAWLSGGDSATDVEHRTKLLGGWILSWKDKKLEKAQALRRWFIFRILQPQPFRCPAVAEGQTVKQPDKNRDTVHLPRRLRYFFVG